MNWLWNKARKCIRARRAEQKTRQRLRVEALENRLVPASIFWSTNQSGAWNVAASWTDANGGHRLPTSADDVFIDSSGPVTVTLGPGTTTVHSFHVAGGDTLNLAGGSLTVLTPPNLAGFSGVSGAALNLAGSSNTSGPTTGPLPSLTLPIVASAVTPVALRAPTIPPTTLFAVYATRTGNSQVLVSQSEAGGTAAEEGTSAPSLDDPTPVAPSEPDPGAAHRPHQTDQVFALAVDRLRTKAKRTTFAPTDFQNPEPVTDATFMDLGQERNWTLADQAATANGSGPAAGVWACLGLLVLVPVKDRKRTAPHT